MSSPNNRSRKSASVTENTKNPVLAAVAALAVVAVFIALGIMLMNRDAAPAAQLQPTLAPFAEATVAPAVTAAPGATAATGDSSVASRNDMYSAAPAMTIDVNKKYTATITTPRGDIVVNLRADLAPIAVNNFVFLARNGFYDGVTWHRVMQGFMAQGGDPTGTGTGGPGYTIKDEFTSASIFDRAGLVAMAKTSAPDSGGSQFFITTAPATHLNGQYTIFGEVAQGQDIVNTIPLRDPGKATTPGEQIVKVTISEQ